MSRRILLATRSAGKLRELQPLFHAVGLEVATLDDLEIAEDPREEAIESHETFEENALAKARWFFARAGIPAVADDSGIEVLALGGEPGVRSKRWSGRAGLTGLELDAANNEELRNRLQRVGDRRARYVCAAAFVDGQDEIVVRGETTGRIAATPRGDGGFGYDPWFESDELGMTFGEAPIEAKQRVSHRGRAFRALIERLRGASSGGVANRPRAD